MHLVGQHSPTNPHLGTQTLSEKVGVWLQKVKTFTHVGSQVTSDDVIARDMLYDVGANSGFGRYYSGWMSINNGPIGMGDGTMHSAITHGAADAGQAVDAVFNTVDRGEISQEMPILQAVLLSFGLTLGPMILVFGLMSGKGITVTFTYYFLIGSMLFMTFIEKFIHYLELSLHASQSYGVYALGNNMIMYNVFTKLYFWGPMIYLGLMSIAGIGLGSVVGKSFDDSVQGSGGKAAKGLVSKAAMFIK